MQLNGDKCKEMVIDFKKISHNFSPLEVDGNKLPVTNYAKMLDVTISSDLKWNNPLNDIVNFYCTTVSYTHLTLPTNREV